MVNLLQAYTKYMYIIHGSYELFSESSGIVNQSSIRLMRLERTHSDLVERWLFGLPYEQ